MNDEKSKEQKKVLVVEDNNDSRAVICRMLANLGFEPISFSSAQEALEGVGKQHIDLALLDVMMPEMDGYQLLKKLREKSEFQETPVIMITAKNRDDDILEGYSEGADYYITKPFTSSQLQYGLNLFFEE